MCVCSQQLLLFLKGFDESERNKLAMLAGILLANGNISASILNSLYNENLVKEGECRSPKPFSFPKMWFSTQRFI